MGNSNVETNVHFEGFCMQCCKYKAITALWSHDCEAQKQSLSGGKIKAFCCLTQDKVSLALLHVNNFFMFVLLKLLKVHCSFCFY